MYIQSAAIVSFECRGKETWFHIQVVPDHAPVYRIQRQYPDFIRLAHALKNSMTDVRCHHTMLPSQRIKWVNKKLQRQRQAEELDQFLSTALLLFRSEEEENAAVELMRFLNYHPPYHRTKALPPAPTTATKSKCDERLQVFLFLGPRLFITVRVDRQQVTLDELRDSLNQVLHARGLDPLPHPSVLAYHHVSKPDRQGALHTLTLNRAEPYVDQDSFMNLATARRLAFFSQADPNEHDAIVLLIESDKDLSAAMAGTWRRLTHVTLTCLAW